MNLEYVFELVTLIEKMQDKQAEVIARLSGVIMGEMLKKIIATNKRRRTMLIQTAAPPKRWRDNYYKKVVLLLKKQIISLWNLPKRRFQRCLNNLEANFA